ncbi:uncharacterized protein LOC144101246 isoform X2 [Amblyomma americanum]
MFTSRAMASSERQPVVPALVLASPTLLLADMDIARGRFTGAQVDYQSPCKASTGETCHVVQQLSAWNEFLSAAQLELRELPGLSGRLSLTSFRDPWLVMPSANERLQAATAAYWLLKRHYCVISFAVSENTLKKHEALFCEALRDSVFLKTLRMKFSRVDGHSELYGVIATLSNLEVLVFDCHRPCTPQFLYAVATLMLTTTSLTTLRMPQLRMEAEGAWQFLEVLRENRTLKDICVHNSVVSAPIVHQVFADYLKNASVLTTLTVEAYFEGSVESLRLVLRGLLQNRTITRVTMTYFKLDAGCAELVPRVFAENTVLRAFNVATVPEDPSRSLQSIYDRWLDALLQNETLEEVCINLITWKTKQWKRFFGELSKKKNLRMVTIDSRYNERHLLPPLCDILRESGADHKVFFGSYNTEDDLELLKSSGFRSYHAYPSLRSKEKFLAVFDYLSNFSHITAVHLSIWTSNIDADMAVAIASFIARTKTLRRLFLSSRPEDAYLLTAHECWATVVSSLNLNRSLRELQVDKVRLNDKGVKGLALAVASSRCIRSVHFIPCRQRDASVFIQALSETLDDNYSLLNLSIECYMEKEVSKQWFAIAEVPRRNAGVVALAAYFANGVRFDRDCAHSLEQVWRSPSLLEELVETSGLDNDVAMAWIRRRLATIEDMDVFMRLAGVVKERIQCLPLPPGDSRLQLDDLDEYCLRMVRRYLTLRDIKADDPTSIA